MICIGYSDIEKKSILYTIVIDLTAWVACRRGLRDLEAAEKGTEAKLDQGRDLRDFNDEIRKLAHRVASQEKVEGKFEGVVSSEDLSPDDRARFNRGKRTTPSLAGLM